jgi:hypothetical protein
MHCTQMLFESKIHIKDKSFFFAVISTATTLNVKKSFRPELYFFFVYFNNENANGRM